MKISDIGFNFVEHCNDDDAFSRLEKYKLFCMLGSDSIDMLFLPYVMFDQLYDVYYFSSKYNNGAVSYYGNAVLLEEEIENIRYVFFSPIIIEKYLQYLKYSNQKSTRERFIHFWKITRHGYKIKVEPCDIFR